MHLRSKHKCFPVYTKKSNAFVSRMMPVWGKKQ